MTPGARTQAAIELLDQMLASWQSEKRIPADKQLDYFFKGHRYIGSKDRGAISELIYWILRHKAALEWWLDRQKEVHHTRSLVLAALMLRKDYDMRTIQALPRDSQYSLAPLTPEETTLCTSLAVQDLIHDDMPPHVRLNYPLWLEEQLKESFPADFDAALTALNQQAPMDLRVNTLMTTREKLALALRQEGYDVMLTPTSPIGLRLIQRAPIFTSPLFREGHFEVQDEGSQMVAQIVGAEPGHRVIDFCAGAGGKTLAIAATMQNKGRVLAWDTSQKRISQMILRLRRAGVGNVQTHIIESENDSFIKRHKHTADRVLVDAPCSGSGTWRRNPDLKWRFTQKDLDEVMRVQQSILQSAARLVKPGGRLIYATCSILKNENERQIENLLKTVNDFRVVCARKIWDKTAPASETDPVSYLWVTPHQDGVDGFFAAVLERNEKAPSVTEEEKKI